MTRVGQLIETLTNHEQAVLAKRTELTVIVEELYRKNIELIGRLEFQAKVDYKTSPLHLTHKVLEATLAKRNIAWIHEIYSSDFENEAKKLKGVSQAVFDRLVERGLQPFIDSFSDIDDTTYHVAIMVSPLATQNILAEYYGSLAES